MQRGPKPRTRRLFLGTLGSVAALGAAGCTGDTEETETAEAELESALEYIEENGDMLEEFERATAVSTTDEVPPFDYSTYQTNVDHARSHVSAADDAAPEAYGDEIDVYHSIVDYQVKIGATNDDIRDYLLCLETVISLRQADRWEDAADHHGECVDTLRDVESGVETSITYLEAIDTSQLDESAQIEFDATGNKLAVGQEELPPLFDFHDGLQSFLDGMTELLAAHDLFDDEQTTAAKLRYSRAEDEFRDAVATFEQLESDPDLPADLEPDVIEMHCFMAGLRDASSHFHSSVDAWENGNQSRYEDETAAANEAIDRCNH